MSEMRQHGGSGAQRSWCAALALALALGGLALMRSESAGGAGVDLSADVAVSQTASVNTATVGQSLTFTVTVENKGPEIATLVKLTEVVDGAVKFVSAASGQGKCFRHTWTFSCYIGRLTESQSTSFTLVVVPTGGGTVTNTAAVGAAEADPDTSNQQSKLDVSAVWVDPSPPVNVQVRVNNRQLPPLFVVATAFPVRWTGADPNSGIGSFDVRYREARLGRPFGGYVDWQKAVSGTRVATFQARPGSTYCFSARATNRGGVMSSWSAESCTATPVGVRALSFAKPWVVTSGSGYYLGASAVASLPGAKLVARVAQARHIDLVASRCPNCGGLYVIWNGRVLRRLSLGGQVKRGVLVPLASFRLPASGTLGLVIASSNKPVRIEGLGISRV